MAPMAPARVGIPPVRTMIFAIGRGALPIWSNPVNLSCNRRTYSPPAATPISAPPYRRASRFDNNGRFGNYSHNRRRYRCRRRSLSHWKGRYRCRRGRFCCRRRRRRCVKVSRISRTDRDDCDRRSNDKMTHDMLPPCLLAVYNDQHLNAA
jgi:hypothetical protein